MHIFIKTLTGKSLKLNIESTSEISELNTQIESLMGVPSDEQILINNGKALSGNVIDSELQEESEVYLVVDIEGGKKKKRRKLSIRKKRNILRKKLSLQF